MYIYIYIYSCVIFFFLLYFYNCARDSSRRSAVLVQHVAHPRVLLLDVLLFPVSPPRVLMLRESLPQQLISTNSIWMGEIGAVGESTCRPCCTRVQQKFWHSLTVNLPFNRHIGDDWWRSKKGQKWLNKDLSCKINLDWTQKGGVCIWFSLGWKKKIYLT